MKEKKWFYQKKWFLWLWLIILPPVGIVLLWTVHKTMKKKTKVILSVVFALWFIILMVAASGDSSDTPTDTGNDTPQTEQGEDIVSEKETDTEETEDTTVENSAEEQEESQKQETGAYGWTTDDYEEFYVALKMIADNYLVRYKLPLYDKWRFAKFDANRIIAMTEELTFKDSHEKHTAICVFMLVGEVGENGLHETVAWSYFATDEKVYYDDGSCDEVFEKITSLSQLDIDKQEEVSANPNANSNIDVTPENFISDIKGLIGDNTVTDITLENSNLCIYVDTNANTTTLPIENWATIQAVSITDNILSLSTQYDTLWDTITVDFGEAGKIINSKSDMDATERCFLDFVLE